MQQRYYDQGVGRFLSVDPVTVSSVNGGNFNRYWYANNNPYRFVDPDGRLARCQTFIVCSEQMRQEDRNPNAGRSNRPVPNLPGSAVPEDAGEDADDSGENSAWEAVETAPGDDGVIELDYNSQLLAVFRYDKARIMKMDLDSGGLANLGFADFAVEIAWRRGDSVFHGQYGGSLFRITGAPGSIGAGPHLGGNLNYVTQGMIWAAAGYSKAAMQFAVVHWNAVPIAGSPLHIADRLILTNYGYDLWSELP